MLNGFLDRERGKAQPEMGLQLDTVSLLLADRLAAFTPAL
jgi:hypothetical protein